MELFNVTMELFEVAMELFKVAMVPLDVTMELFEVTMELIMLRTFLSSVLDHVPSEVFLPEERLRTFGTFDRFGTLVDEFDVRRETYATIESAIAMRTRECVLAGMMEYVGTQLYRLYERFAAKLTRVRFLAGVRAKMAIQRLLRGESSLALRKKKKTKCREKFSLPYDRIGGVAVFQIIALT